MTISPISEVFLDAPRLWPVALAIALVMLIAVGRLYIPQVRPIALPWRWLLPALRAMALIALAASILKPVAVHSATPTASGAVAIVVDRSASMGARDLAWLAHSAPSTQPDDATARGSSTLVALADGLGLLKRGLRNTALTSLRVEFLRGQDILVDLTKARGEVSFARVSSEGLAAARVRFSQLREQFRSVMATALDHSSAFSITSSSAKSAAALRNFVFSRRESQFDDLANHVADMVSWAEDAQSASDLALYKSDSSVRAVCDKLAPLSRFQRAALALNGGGAGQRAGLLAKMPLNTELFGYTVADSTQPLPLGEASQRGHLPAEPIGPSTDLIGGVETALAHSAGQPIQAVILISDGRQSKTEPTTISPASQFSTPIFCIDAAAPKSLLRDISVTDLLVPTSCFVGETITARVQIQASGAAQTNTTVSLAVDDSAPTTRPAVLNDQQATVPFPVKFEKPGVHYLIASVPSTPDAPTDQNKRVGRWVKVLDDKINIAIYAGSADWDYQYVSNALSRTPWVNLTRGILPTGGPAVALTPDQILDLNLLILDDVPITAFSRPQWEAINQLVTDRGGSVLLIAGEENIPRYALHPLTGSLLPYPTGRNAVWRDWPGRDAGFHLAPAPGTQTLDALKLITDQADADEYWSQLPAFFRYLSLPALKPAAHALLVERESASPLLVENRVGLGRTFFLAMHETWRWRYKVGERDQDRFWLQLARYASDEPYAAHAPGVWLDADPVSARPMQPIHLRARIVEQNQKPSQAPLQTAELYRNNRVLKRIELKAVGSGLGRYSGTLTGTEAGEYQLRLLPQGRDRAAELPLHIAASTEEEMANIAGDPQFLRQLAQDSGGAFLTLDQIQTLPALMNRARMSQIHLIQRPIWDSYYLFSFVVACFAVEWAIRKRVGLA